MKTVYIFAFVALLAGLASCTTAQIKATVETQVASDIAKKDCPTLIPDLQNQIVMANAATPPDTYGAKCAQVTIQLCQQLIATATAGTSSQCSTGQFFNPNLNAAGQPIGCQLGAATGIEALRIAATTPTTAVKFPAYWVEGCAVVYNDLKISAIDFLNQIGLDLGKYNLGALGVAL
jgi:hypothetical protein